MKERTLYFIRRFLLPQWVYVLIVFATGAIAAASSGLGVPAMIKFIFPLVFRSDGETPQLLLYCPQLEALSPSALLLLACASMPLLFLIRGLATWVNGYMVNVLGIRILEDVRITVFRRLQELPLAFHEKHQKGDLISRLTADAANVQNILGSAANDLVKQPVTCLSACAAFIWLLFSTGQGFLLLVNMLFIALAAVPIALFGKRISARAQQAQQSLGSVNTVLQQNLETQREVRAYALEERQTQEFRRACDRSCYLVVRVVKYQRAIIPIIEVATALALAVLLVRARQAGMQFNDFLSIAAALFFLFDSMKRAGNAINRLNEAQGSLARLAEVLQEPNTMPDPAQPKTWAAPVRGDITFRHLSFRYEGAKEDALHDIDLHIPAGQVVGLVGPSGSGKTTFVNLIPRFCDATAGAVLVDGLDVREVTQHHLREQLSLVGQQALLFNATIRENILLGKEGATEAEVNEAAAAAAVTDFLAAQPKGIDTPAGEAGGNLSGGQRQRVAIARTFIKAAPILILDEATASLDAESEREIQEQLDTVARGRTTLIVAHRFSTLRNADRILVFNCGHIIGDGTHDALYAHCDLYRELYDRQGI